MILNSPIEISPRLLPCVRIGNAIISITYSDKSDREGRTVYEYFIDTPEWEHTNDNDLKSGCQGGSLQSGLESLLSFLAACGESYGYRQRTGHEGENESLFPPNVAEWAYQNSDELGMLSIQLEEESDLIQE